MITREEYDRLNRIDGELSLEVSRTKKAFSDAVKKWAQNVDPAITDVQVWGNVMTEGIHVNRNPDVWPEWTKLIPPETS